MVFGVERAADRAAALAVTERLKESLAGEEEAGEEGGYHADGEGGEY
jgi:hypothetical protein